MIKRMAVVGLILVVAGPFNLSGYGTITTGVGLAALLVAGVAWALGRRRGSRSGPE